MAYFNIVAQTTENTVVTEYEFNANRSENYQSEAELEHEFIRMLTEQGYDYLPIHTENDLVDNLRTKLEELNEITFSDAEWKQFFSTAIANPNDHIIEKTRKIQEDYIQVLRRDDGTTKNITLIDKRNIHNNRLQVINQYVINKADGAKHDNRYDVTVLVNGLPLVHIELKRRGVPVREAFNQIDRYQRDSFWAGSGLFEYVQIFVISNIIPTAHALMLSRTPILLNPRKRKPATALNSLRSGLTPKTESYLILWISQKRFLRSTHCLIY